MQAMMIDAFGDPSTLEAREVDDPAMGPDAVLVETRAAGVNPVDWKIISGGLQGAFPHHFPLIPGWDVAGVVRAIGPAVQEFVVGDEVMGYVRKDHVRDGTYAELVAARPRHLAPRPSSVSFAAAAALPLAGLTALQSLRLVGVAAGDTVLVHGAAGGVGLFAVQLAASRGATVIGTASERNHDYLRDLGAIPVSYGDGLAERVADAAPDGLSAAVDYVGTDEAFAVSARLVADPARISSNVDPEAVAEVGGRYCFVRPQADDLAHLSKLVDSGELRIEVQQTYALTDAAAALEESRDGHVRGKLALTI